jgi:eukaryotic-like serine/threonine-protein kinase
MTTAVTADAATFAWDDLSERLERFIATWDSGREPALADFLPPEPPGHRRVVLVELIKVDLEQRTTRGQPKRLETYVADFPELLENGEPPCDLIYEEYHIRRTAGDNVAPRDYYQRFPRSADALKRLMGTDDFSVTTQVGAARRIEGFAAGQKLDDFDLLIELGKGAFGCVYLARQLSMQRLVALKISADKGNEPQTLAQLDHPNIVRVFDQRRLPDVRVRLLYMQFAPGGTLADVIRHVQKTPPAARTGAILAGAVEQALERSGAGMGGQSNLERRLANTGWPQTVCRLGIQLAQALDYAHKAGILHRDVKPANILLAADGSPKLADFNISFCSQLDGASPAAYFGGSLAYMSPEQIEACNPQHDREPQDLDGRSDLFALAVILWELLYAERPFREDSLEEGWTAMLVAMADRRHREPPAAPPGPRDPVTNRLEQVLRRTLAPNPDDRPKDGVELARALALCLSPGAYDLVNNLKTGWRDFARRHPIFALFPVNMPPFLLAGPFNLWFNVTHYVPQLKAELQAAFWQATGPVNGILYPLGIALVLAFAAPVAKQLRRLNRGESPTPEELAFARRRSLVLGHGVAAVGLVLWLVAGIAFPSYIHLATGRFPATGYLHFLLSMLACGIISCCFPFLGTTWLSVRVFFPALLAGASPDPAEHQRLTALGRQAGYYLFTSPVSPLLALLLVMWSGRDTRAATIILVIVAIGGFAAAYVTWQRIRADLEALSIVAKPTESLGLATDTATTF